jgi:hypothetical protein
VKGNNVRAPGTETATILITVKTYPTPSQHHVETVCVAGVRVDQPQPSWVRLYPIPFRALGQQEQFKKYQLIRAEITPRGGSDLRPESYRPTLQTMELLDVIDSKRNWAKRRQLIGPLIGATTTCELIAINRATSYDRPAPSLGLVQPEVLRIEALEYRPWNLKQLEKVRRASEPDLFNAPLQELQPVPHRLRVTYRCMESGCPKHRQEILDWELGVAGVMWQARYGVRTGEMVFQHWESMLMDPEKDVHLYVGNQHQYRHSFSILGAWYPKWG